MHGRCWAGSVLVKAFAVQDRTGEMNRLLDHFRCFAACGLAEPAIEGWDFDEHRFPSPAIEEMGKVQDPFRCEPVRVREACLRATSQRRYLHPGYTRARIEQENQIHCLKMLAKIGGEFLYRNDLGLRRAYGNAGCGPHAGPVV